MLRNGASTFDARWGRIPHGRYFIEALEQRRLLSSGWDVALIDRTLPKESVLERAMVKGGHVILYDGHLESARQVLARAIDWAKSSGSTIRSLSLLSHATSGRFELGNQWISKGGLEQIAGDLKELGRFMSDRASVNLFGCNLVDGLGDGQTLINRMAKLLNARIFASQNVTGRGGDWVLEAASRGGSDPLAAIPFSIPLLRRWQYSLATGVTVTPTSGLITTESGGTATFTMKLNTSPGGNPVTFGLSSSNIAEGAVSPLSVTFSSANWSVPQTITITGVDDFVVDGSVAYTIVTAPGVAAGGSYNGINPADVSVTNVDNDTPGVTVSPTSGLTTTEAGGTASFSVFLNSVPSANVVIPLSSSNLGEGTVSPASLTFTTANYSTPQVVTVTGVDDQVDDGDSAYGIVTGAATSADANYNGLNATDISLTNADDDTASFTVTPTSGLITTEAGGGSSFSVKLNSQPTANVVLGISSSNSAEGTVSSPSLTFTTANWNTPQTVTISGVDDFVDDADVSYSIVTAAAVSADAVYSGMNPSDVSVTNTDNDTAGFSVSPASGLITTEAGGTTSFTIALTSEPTANVTIGMTSSNTAEGTVSPASLVFTAANWNTAQSVTISGVDDFVDDGDIAYSIVTAAATSADAVYSGLNPADVSVTNLDNDTAGITVSPTSGLTTTEAGASASFTIVLDSQPTANVTIPLSSSNALEGTPSAVSVLFTTANWSTPQTITVNSVDDFVDDGDIAYSIVTAAATSTDPSYGGRNAADVSVTNLDDDTAGITVSPTSGLTTTEAGGTASFTVVLSSKPTASVSVGLSSSNTGEGTLSTSTLIFTTANWNTPQTVTVTGVNDFIDDGDVGYSIVTAAATSGDANYNGRNPSDVSATNIDNDIAGMTVSPTSGLTTSEAGGAASFTVALNSQPSADVIIGLASSNASEGTISASTLTFTPATWNAPQTVTISGVDDHVDDGDIGYSITTAAAVSADSLYNGMNPADVSVTNIDNDTAGITVSPAAGLTTTEAGGAASFIIALNSQPTASVTIGLTSSNAAEGTISASSVTFTVGNWNTPQTIAISGVDDSVDDGDIAYSIVTAAAVSADALYNGTNAPDVSVTNIDNDTAGVTVTPTAGLTTSEAGGTAGFTVTLNSKPLASVVIGISSSDPAEGAVSASSLTFTSANWNTPQSIIVSGVDDQIDDGDVGYSVITAAASSADVLYNGINAGDVSVTNTDDDTAGITVSPTSGLITSEAAGAATFAVVLTSQPTAAVSVGLSSSDTSEGAVSPASVTFTAGNWNAPQTITVTGVDDFIDDGDIAYTIVTAAATSADPDYSGRNASDVAATNTDDDTAGIVVNPTSGLVTSEAGGTDSFTIVLSSQPTANVTIPLSSSNTAEGTLSVSSVTFTAGNWNAPQSISLTGVNDNVDDGDIGYAIVTGGATSADTNYSGLNPTDVAVTNTDDDSAGIVVAPTSGLVTSDGGASDTFTVVLTSQPAANVVIALSSSQPTEGTVSTAQLTFTAGNWNIAQTVTVTGANDFIDDGDTVYSIVTAPATSADANYNGLNASDVSVTNLNDDTAGFTFTPSSGLTTTEAGGAATFTIELNSQPLADVTLDLSSSDLSEGTVSPVSVTFTAANWNTPQTITITGVNDFANDGNIDYSIVTAAAVSADAKYNGLDPVDLSVTNIDDDTPGITIAPASGLNTSEAGGSASFSVQLNTQPTGDVIIGLSSSNALEGTVSASSLTFTSANWNTPQTVTISGVDDDVDDGDIAYSIITDDAISADPGYNGMIISDVSVTNVDDDTAGVTVSPASGLTTSEAGGAATFSIVLGSRPTGSVSFSLSTSDPAEGTVATASVSFTAADWNTPQIITVTGQDDWIDDGSVAYSIATGAVTSVDPKYSGINPTDVSVTNLDDDTAGISITPNGSTTTEAGGTMSFAVVLTSEPTADVTIGLASSNTAEGVVSAPSLEFTAANWNTPQTVGVTGVDDAIDDGDIAYSIVTAAASSADANYNGMNSADVQLTNIDDDTRGISVSPTSGLTTTEAGGTASFTVVLNSQPTANVTIPLSSSNPGEGALSISQLVFTAGNWNTPQTVTIRGVDDDVDDGDIGYSIITAAATSGDADYNGLNASDVSVTNLDNDTAGVTVSPTSGLVTRENGATSSFTVVLNSRPSADVVVGISSSNTAEGTVSAASLTFTAVNWNLPQTVTVSGVDDFVDDGDITYSVITAAASSADLQYSGIDPADVAVTNFDDDTAEITVTPTTGLKTTEAGGTASFTVVLDSQPTANVTVPLVSGNTAEGIISTASLTFTAANWNVPQTVTVSGVNDFVDDSDIGYSIMTAAASSADPRYSGMNPADVSVTNVDDDAAGVVVTPTTGLITSEAGGSDQFTLVLSSQPTANVTISLSSGNSGEGMLSAGSVTFTPGNWNVSQRITVTGVDDSVADGDIAYSVITGACSSADGNYNGLNPADVSAVNTDNDTAGISVSQTSGLTTTEAAGAASFSIVLNSKPTASVSIGLSSSNTGEGTVTPSSVTFTAANWNVPQTVTIVGIDDAIDDGDAAYSILTAAAVSADPNYSGLDPANLSVTNIDDDTAGVTVSPNSGLLTTESGGTASFSIVLNTQPAANVIIPLSSSDSGEGTLGISQLVFTSANWNTPQVVTVSGVDDAIDDGEVAYKVITAGITSADSNYSGLDPADVSLVNTDDDAAGISVTPTSGLVTTEAGGSAMFNIVLTSEPTANVTIGLSSSNAAEGTVSVASVTFTPSNWNTPQTISISGVDDLRDDGDVGYSIITAPASSADPNYNSRNGADLSVTSLDDDVAGITVTPTSSLTTTEAGGTATFSIVLDSQPTANVTIGVSSSNIAEGKASVSSVIFTPADWNTPTVVTISGIDDFVDDGDISFTIVNAAASSSDAKYSGMSAADVSVTNLDDDVAGISVSPTSGLITTEAGGTASFSLALDSQPTANVTIGLSSSNTAEGTLLVSGITFRPANWNAPQLVTIKGVDDAIDDGNVSYDIITAPANSADGKYAGMNPANVAVSNTDNDAAGFTVTPISGLITTEAGGSASFTVRLNSQPTANVSVNLSSSNMAEGTVSASSLLFTPANWNVARTVTVIGVDDDLADGNIVFNAILSSASADANYAAIDPPDVSVTNLDDDFAGITVTPTSGLLTTEAGGKGSFSIVLDSQPTADVTIPLSSNKLTEGTISVSSVSFTPANWYLPQIVTVTGVDDVVEDGDVSFKIVTAPATSVDASYNGRDAGDVNVTNSDDDVAEVHVTPITGLTTSEAGGAATFSIVLTSQPTSGVTVSVSSSNPTEGTLSVNSVSFDPSDWSTPHIVTVRGADDLVQDGDISYTILTAPAVSSDPVYSGINGADVSVTNLDNDAAGITVTPVAGLSTTEAGATASFTVALDAQPSANVRIAVVSSNPGEASASVSRLIFTPTSWNIPQMVTITGVDDSRIDGDQPFTILLAPAISGDVHYNGLDPHDAAGVNRDNDVAGIIVSRTSGLITRERGTSDSFTVVLASEPSADVIVNLASSDVTEGVLSTASLTFTAADWNIPQTVTAIGVDDTLPDGDVAYTIVTDAAMSADPNYAGVNAPDVSASNIDNDTIGVAVTSLGGLVTSETGTSVDFNVVLTKEPSDSVTLHLGTSDPSRGIVSRSTLTFTPDNWDTPRTVSVSGVNDLVDDGNHHYDLIISVANTTDADYLSLPPTHVTLTNTNDDKAGVTITPVDGSTTSESGGSAAFDVVLDSQPLGNVVLSLRSRDRAEGTLRRPTLKLNFTPGNWNVPQRLIVTGVDDGRIDGNVSYRVVLQPALGNTDPAYAALPSESIYLSNVDNDIVGATITPVGHATTSESGGAATFTVVLTAPPRDMVSLRFNSRNRQEGRLHVSTMKLYFTPKNWNVPQQITVFGVDDHLIDGNVLYRILVRPALDNLDSAYASIKPISLYLTNFDNDNVV